jgi:hypothetical protein
MSQNHQVLDMTRPTCISLSLLLGLLLEPSEGDLTILIILPIRNSKCIPYISSLGISPEPCLYNIVLVIYPFSSIHHLYPGRHNRTIEELFDTQYQLFHILLPGKTYSLLS